MKHASLRKRFIAFVIDTLIVSLFVSIISSGYNTTRVDVLNKELNEVMNKYVSEEISETEYVEAVSSIGYDISKANMVGNSIYVVICIGYFVMFQYLNNGASIGKRIMNIKVLTKDNKKANIFRLFLHSCIIYEMLPILLGLLFLYLFRGYTFLLLSGLVNLSCFVFLIVSIFMIWKREDKLALNDIMSGCIVIESK